VVRPWGSDLIEYLQASPELVELNLRGHSSQALTKTFFAHFASEQSPEGSTAHGLVPMLHTLRVDYTPALASRFNIFDLANALQSRIAFDVLKRVEIRCVTAVNANFMTDKMPRLRQLRDMGLDISVLDGDMRID
jgi:hypothetical protein